MFYQAKHSARNALTWLLAILFLLQPNAAIAFSSSGYDANDNVLTETNALGKTTVYTYDGVDNRTSVTDALGNRSEFTYNSLGQVLTSKDALNNTTTITYDANGRVLKTKDAQNNETINGYSLQTGQLTSTTDALGSVTRFEYLNGYLTKETDAQGNETAFTYDLNGNRNSQRVKRTNAQGQLETITTAFDRAQFKYTAKDGTEFVISQTRILHRFPTTASVLAFSGDFGL